MEGGVLQTPPLRLSQQPAGDKLGATAHYHRLDSCVELPARQKPQARDRPRGPTVSVIHISKSRNMPWPEYSHNLYNLLSTTDLLGTGWTPLIAVCSIPGRQ